MFLVVTSLGRISQDEEITDSMAALKPYREWLDPDLSRSTSLPKADNAPPIDRLRRR